MDSYQGKCFTKIQPKRFWNVYRYWYFAPREGEILHNLRWTEKKFHEYIAFVYVAKDLHKYILVRTETKVVEED